MSKRALKVLPESASQAKEGFTVGASGVSSIISTMVGWALLVYFLLITKL